MRFTVIFILLLSVSGFAQSTRSLINKGVEQYEQEKYSDAEVSFKKGLENDFESFEGHFNLGDALYKQGRYEEALKEYQNALSFAKDDFQKSKVFHNIGNTLLKAKKLKESIGAYANSLKLNPEDLDTKYNLSYALKQMQQQQKNQQNKNKNDKNQKDKDKQKKQQNNKNDNKDKQQQNKQQQNKQQQNKQQQQKQNTQKQKLDKEQAKRILEALKNKEAKLQKKLRKQKGKAVKKDKDW